MNTMEKNNGLGTAEEEELIDITNMEDTPNGGCISGLTITLRITSVLCPTGACTCIKVCGK